MSSLHRRGPSGSPYFRHSSIDCSDEVRTARLTTDRLQPDLANGSMMGWAQYLRLEASEKGYEILDTSEMSLAEGVQRIVSCQINAPE